MNCGLVSKKLFVIVCGALCFVGVNQANATFIRHADTVTTSVATVVSLDNISNQSGLSSPYVNGVTEFDTYDPGSVIHDYPWGNEWFAGLGIAAGSLTFDLGYEFTIDRVAFWNEDSGGIDSVEVFSSTDGVNWSTSLGVFSLTNNALDAGYTADVFKVSTIARYVKFNLTATNPTDQGYASTLAIGEVAFSVAESVPEPGTMVLFGSGLLGLLGVVKRKKH